MKTTLLRPSWLPWALAVAALPLGSRLCADVATTTHADITSRVRLTTPDEYKDRGFGHLKSEAVRGADGHTLGHVRDLVLDAKTGEPRFVVVSGGGFVGLGGDSRLLPLDALMRDPKGDDYLTRLERVDWDLLPTLDKADIKEGRVALTAEEQRNLPHLRQQSWARAFDALSAPADPRVQRFVFASSIAGKALYADDQKVGKVDDLLLDPANGPALAVVEIDRDFVGGADHHYLVPIGHLIVTAGDAGRVHTNLAAAEFQQAAGIAPDPDAGEHGPWVRIRDNRHDHHAADVRRDTDEPTRNSLDTRGENQDRANRDVVTDRGLETTESNRTTTGDTRTGGVEAELLASAARAVREVWNGDPDLQHCHLTATPSDDRLVLEGTVATKDLADRAETVARHATTRIRIDNQIRVDDDRR